MKQLIKHEKRIPVTTWRWLKVNDAELTLYGDDREAFPVVRIPSQVRYSHSLPEYDLSRDAAGYFNSDEVRSFLDQYANSSHYITIPENYTAKEPILLVFDLKDGSPVLTDDVIIEAEEGSKATVIIQYCSNAGDFHHCGRTRVIAKKNASIELIKAQLLDHTSTHTDSIGVYVEEHARARVLLAEMGAANPLSSCNIVLSGEESEAELDILYYGNQNRSIDLSSRVEHRGEKSKSRIRAHGILTDHSKKILRDTLDFISGSKGSKGREEEQVLMLDPHVKNVSVPILLCGEDDVEGEHAASSGKPDDKKMFYLMSRGISESEARKLLAEAAFSSIVETIPEEGTKNKILNTLRISITGGEG